MLRAKPQFVAFAPIDLKNVTMYLRDGFNNGAVTPSTTDIEPIGETTIALTNGDLYVPDNASVVFGAKPFEEYDVVSATRTGGTDTKFNLDLGAGSGGGYTLIFRGDETELLAFDASIADVELALEALCGIPVTTLTMTDNTGDYDLEFGGSLGDRILTIADDLQIGTDNTTGGTGMALTIGTPGVLATATTVLVITPGLLTATTAGGMVTFKGEKIDVTIGEGNLSYKETYNRDYRKNRGLLNTVRNADEEPLEVTFDFTWEYISSCGAIVPSIAEALKGIGPAADWVNSAADICEPHAVNIELWNVPICTGTNLRERYVFADFRVESLDHNVGDSQVSCSGKCNILEPEIRRY